MMEWLLLGLMPLSIGLPLLSAALLCITSLEKFVMRVTPVAPLPAIITALAAIVVDAPDVIINFPWLMLGHQLILDTTGQIFLLLTGVVWWVSAMMVTVEWCASQQRFRLFMCYLLAMGGNVGVVLAGDVMGFYTYFALMSFAVYGLIVDGNNSEAVRAARVYITLVMIGEVALFSAIVIGAQFANISLMTPWHDFTVTAISLPLILIAFGIKAGAIPFHFVLPIVYRVAPTGAAVAIGGAMINTALLGWLRFLPLGEISIPSWGGLLVTIGLIASLAGVVIGLMQDNPKALLGYSSVSQMGIMISIIGLALIDHNQWQLLVAVLLLYALHHALAKGALFCSVYTRYARGHFTYYWLCFALLLPALSIAGAPLSSGALVKTSLKAALSTVPETWVTWFLALISISTVATTLLMIRFVKLVWPKRSQDKNYTSVHALGQLLLVLFVAGGTWLIANHKSSVNTRLPVQVDNIWASLWPLAVGIIIALLAVRLLQFYRLRLIRVPAGDIIVPVEIAVAAIMARLNTLVSRVNYMCDRRHFPHSLKLSMLDTIHLAEGVLRKPLTVGVLFIITFTVMLLLLV